jgi:hypothetical protein
MKTRKPAPLEGIVKPSFETNAAAEALAEELKKNDQPPPRQGFGGKFPSAQPQGGKPEVPRSIQRIVETTFLLDDEIDVVAKRLVADLSIGPQRADYGTVMAHLDRAEENARLAVRLMLTGKMARDRYELEVAPLVASMRAEATLVLQREKDQGKRSKAITDADVEGKAVELFRDEWQSIHDERRQLELTVRGLEHQTENWASRCRTLQTIASKLR